ncbi:DDE-type integrase/transposase/recombinase [Austwickia chelonae]|uniref:DDE-type integrase/transposase/recombinase n=1 Tax=Austwickia chelonae TaxID=100225 RepID=UPI003D31F2D5
MTEQSTAEDKLHLCAVKDACSGWIVGYSAESRMNARLAGNAVEKAVVHHSDVADCIVHSDRGSRFRMRKLVHTLNRHGLAESMGHVGTAGGNAGNPPTCDEDCYGHNLSQYGQRQLTPAIPIAGPELRTAAVRTV